MVRLGIDGVVNRNAIAGTQRAIGVDHGIAAAIGQHEIQGGKRAAKRVVGCGPELGQSGWCIDIPEDFQRRRVCRGHHLGKQQLVLEADAARLDDDLRLAASCATRFNASTVPS